MTADTPIRCKVVDPKRGDCECSVCGLYKIRERLMADFFDGYRERVEAAQRRFGAESREAFLIADEAKREWRRHDPITPQLVRLSHLELYSPIFIGMDLGVEARAKGEADKPAYGTSPFISSGELAQQKLDNEESYRKLKVLVTRESYVDILARQPRRTYRAPFPNPEPLAWRPKL
jgi:hypothetical protein